MTNYQIALLGIIIFIIWLRWQNTKTDDGIDRKLLEAADGDREVARRFLIQARAKYLSRSERWYIKQAILELHGDRKAIAKRRSRFSFNRVASREFRENVFLLGNLLLLLNSVILLFGH